MALTRPAWQTISGRLKLEEIIPALNRSMTDFFGIVGTLVEAFNRSSSRTVTVAGALKATDYFVRGNAAAGAFVFSLLPAVDLLDKEFVFKNVGAVNNMTLDADGGELIDTALTRVLTPGQSVRLKSNGTGWDSL